MPARPSSAAQRRPHDDPYAAVEWWQSRVEKPLFVYVIQDGDDGAVKIGKAFNPASRLAELQCGNPHPLALRSVVLAHHNTEENLHILWAEYRVRGEWFGSGMAGAGQPDRYKLRGRGYVRIQPADHPSVQEAIIRLALEAQRKQVDAAASGTPEDKLHWIACETIVPHAEWPECKARSAA